MDKTNEKHFGSARGRRYFGKVPLRLWVRRALSQCADYSAHAEVHRGVRERARENPVGLTAKQKTVVHQN